MRSRLLLLLIGLCFLPSPCLLAEEERKNLFIDLLQDQKTLWSTPLRGSTWEQPKTYLFLGATAASLSLDGDPSKELREDLSFRDFNDFFDSTPADIVLASYPAAVLAAGHFSGNADLFDYGLKSTRGALNAFAATVLLKAAFQRARPHTGETYGFWEGGNSFPSGHATVAWTLAAVTSNHYGDHKWVSWVAYATAGVISFSRVSAGHHFASDAVAGSLLGFAIGHYLIQ